MLSKFLFLTISVLLTSHACAQSAITNELNSSYSDSTSIPGVFFALDGPYKQNLNKLVISESTSIRFFRKDKDQATVPAIVYQIDDGNQTAYSAPFKLKGTGSHKVMLRQIHPDGESNTTMIILEVDATPPVVMVRLIYKSITLKQFQFPEIKGQSGTIPVECPVGTELHIFVEDDLSGVKSAFLTEGKATFSAITGFVELRSRGKHQYTILARDFVNNLTESSPIVLDIVEQ